MSVQVYYVESNKSKPWSNIQSITVILTTPFLPLRSLNELKNKTKNYNVWVFIEGGLFITSKMQQHDCMYRDYLVNGNSEKLPNVTPHDIIEVAIKQCSLVNQTIHSEVDVLVLHLSPAFSYNLLKIGGVMHHHQNYWFTTCKQRDNRIKWFRNSGSFNMACMLN